VTRFREAFPIVAVEDVDRAADFYCSALGFERTFSFEEDGESAFAFLALEPLGIGLARSAPGDPPFSLWIYADDVDEAAAQLRAAGAEELQAPSDQEWGERMCTFRDADGTVIHVGRKR
jgi:uncharacterized glyoxalase superfamily protein PhnB